MQVLDNAYEYTKQRLEEVADTVKERADGLSEATDELKRQQDNLQEIERARQVLRDNGFV